MRYFVVVLLIFVGAFLFIAARKGWVHSATLQTLTNVGGFISMLAAIFLFVVAAASPPDSNRSSSAERSGSPSNLNANVNVAAVNSPLPSPTPSQTINPTPSSTPTPAVAGSPIKVCEGDTVRVMDGAIIISVDDINVLNEVKASIGSPGYPNLEIDNKRVGFRAVYKAKKSYEVRIERVNYYPSPPCSEFSIRELK